VSQQEIPLRGCKGHLVSPSPESARQGPHILVWEPLADRPSQHTMEDRPKGPQFDGSGDVRSFVFQFRVLRRQKMLERPDSPWAAEEYTMDRLVASHLSGEAVDWVRSRGAQEQLQMPWVSADALLAELVQHFAPVDDVQHARDQLGALKQRGPVRQYIAAFRACAIRIPDFQWNGAGLWQFVNGLKGAVAYEVQRGRPTTFEQACNLAACADKPCYDAAKAAETAAAAAVQRALRDAGGGPAPMELGAAMGNRGAPAAAGGFNPSACYICHGQGHGWKRCPNKRRYPCSKCGRVGHPAVYCRAHPGARGR
jgi:hypothetical protein